MKYNLRIIKNIHNQLCLGNHSLMQEVHDGQIRSCQLQNIFHNLDVM